MVTSPAIDVTAEVAGWYLYRFRPRPGLLCALGAQCGRRHPLYIGISNEPWRRHAEHLKDKDWIDDVAGYDIDPRTFTSEADARAAEKTAIHTELPLANDVHNRGNPHRLIYGDKPPRALRAPAARRPAATPVRAARSLSRRQQRAAAWTASTVVLTAVAVLWWQVAVWPAAFGSVGLHTAVWVSLLPRRKRARLKRWTVRAAIVAGVLFLLWQLGPAIMPPKIG